MHFRYARKKFKKIKLDMRKKNSHIRKRLWGLGTIHPQGFVRYFIYLVPPYPADKLFFWYLDSGRV